MGIISGFIDPKFAKVIAHNVQQTINLTELSIMQFQTITKNQGNGSKKLNEKLLKLRVIWLAVFNELGTNLVA